MAKVACVDLFCGAGGLTCGLELEGIPVAAGVDVDPACRYPYEANNKSRFIQRDVDRVRPKELRDLFGEADVRILAGCAPCQPFSTYARRYNLNEEDGKWGLLYQFTRLIKASAPDVVTMENVPSVAKHLVFRDFVDDLHRLGYRLWYKVVDSSEFGVPQMRKRVVLLGSRFGDIEFVNPSGDKPKTVRQAIGRMRSLEAGTAAPGDRMHAAATLSAVNLERIKASKPGGSWRDWPAHLVAKCHRTVAGQTYSSVYGRMEWDKPAPTMTTQCYGFGNGRFGHPEQNRAISLREAAMLQGFSRNYSFVPKGESVNFSTVGRLIGNAVPVGLARAIGRSIKRHLGLAGV